MTTAAKVYFFGGSACWAIAAFFSFFLKEYLLLFTSLGMIAVILADYKFSRAPRGKFWWVFGTAVPFLLCAILLARAVSTAS